MGAKIQRRAILIFLVSIVGLYIVLMPHDRVPGQKDFTSWTQIKSNLSKNIHLGLDLRGGSHLVMQVKANEVIEEITQKNVDVAKHTLNDKEWKFNDVKETGTGEITITVPDRTKNSDIISELNNDFGSGWRASEIGNTIAYRLDQNEQNALRERATEQAMQIIENRINAFGVAESTLQRQGSNDQYRILLEMPGVDDPERVKATLKAESHLDLKPVAKGTQISPPYPTEDQARQALATLPGGPDNYEVLPIHERRAGGSPIEGFVIVEKTPVVSGKDLRDAQASSGQYGGENYQINFQLTPDGSKRFGDWTGAHIQDHLAIVLNREVKSAPTIEARITDRGQITGSFTQQDADDLALVLRSGSVPAGVEYLEERTVGPSLGADSIREGVTASIAGLLAVMAFMLWYYRLSGVNAVLALLLNLVLLLACLVVAGATLTLPGIAGVIL